MGQVFFASWTWIHEVTRVLDSHCSENGDDNHVRKWPWRDFPLPYWVRNALFAIKMSEKNRVAILELMKQSQNNTCADCGASSKSLKFILSSWPTGSVFCDLSFKFAIDFHHDFLCVSCRSRMGFCVEGNLHLYHMQWNPQKFRSANFCSQVSQAWYVDRWKTEGNIENHRLSMR